MANLVVRNVDEKIVRSLKLRAGQHGISAEAEHRRILEAALHVKPRRKSFKEILSSMPDVGEDTDFIRQQQVKNRDVFD